MPVEKTFTRGNVWSIIASIVTTTLGAGSVIVYVTIKLTVMETVALANANDNRSQDVDLAAQEVRIRGLEQDVIRQEERYANMMALLGRVDSRTERIEQALQERPAP